MEAVKTKLEEHPVTLAEQLCVLEPIATMAPKLSGAFNCPLFVQSENCVHAD